MVAARTRRTLVAVLGAVAALAIAVAVYGRGCSSDDDGPEATALQFLAASQAGDKDGMLALLSEDSRSQLSEAARRATELVGGGRRYRPQDMLRASPSDTRQPQLTEESRSKGRVTYRIANEPLVLVKEEGAWRVQLPPAPPHVRSRP